MKIWDSVYIFVFKFEQSVTYFHWKILDLAGIWTRYLTGTKPICYQLSYPGLDCHFITPKINRFQFFNIYKFTLHCITLQSNFHLNIQNLQSNLSTSSLILPSYTIRATIFEKVFWPEKFPKTEYFPYFQAELVSFQAELVSFQAELVNFTSLLEFIFLNRGKMTSFVGRAKRAFWPILA